MRKIICMLLVMLCFVFPALAEETSPLSPYVLSAPPAVEIVDNEGSFTYVYGVSRVVAMMIERVPDDNPAQAVIRMMSQFEPDAVIGEDLVMAEGFVGLTACQADKFGDGVDQITVMILSDAGNLLILSGYDMNGDEEQVQQLLDTLLSNMSVNGTKIVIAKK